VAVITVVVWGFPVHRLLEKDFTVSWDPEQVDEDDSPKSGEQVDMGDTS